MYSVQLHSVLSLRRLCSAVINLCNFSHRLCQMNLLHSNQRFHNMTTVFTCAWFIFSRYFIHPLGKASLWSRRKAAQAFKLLIFFLSFWVYFYIRQTIRYNNHFFSFLKTNLRLSFEIPTVPPTYHSLSAQSVAASLIIGISFGLQAGQSNTYTTESLAFSA